MSFRSLSLAFSPSLPCFEHGDAHYGYSSYFLILSCCSSLHPPVSPSPVPPEPALRYTERQCFRYPSTTVRVLPSVAVPHLVGLNFITLSPCIFCSNYTSCYPETSCTFLPPLALLKLVLLLTMFLSSFLSKSIILHTPRSSLNVAFSMTLSFIVVHYSTFFKKTPYY